MEKVSGVMCYIDDVLVTGKNDEEHLRNLEEVLKRLSDRGFRLKKGKCCLFKPSVEYLGYRVDADGLHTTTEKVEAILNAPHPTDVRQLRSFLGLVNYYGRFVPDLATTAHPLNDLLKLETKWKWTDECEAAFCKLKEQLASTSVLAHYDVHLPLKLACDASAYGVGAVISHVMSDGSERPVAYASRTLSKSEQNYPQIEKEALSIVFGVKKFHKFLYGRRFTMVTDHKPLVTILGPRSQIPTLAAARMQRWALLLTAYHYEVEFRGTEKHGNADGLSRVPLPTLPEEVVLPVTQVNLLQINSLPVRGEHLRAATSADPLLSRVLKYTMEGWPLSVSTELQPFSRRQNELTIEAGCLLWGIRVVVPEKYRKIVLEELHTSHPGIVRMKSLARLHVWWPSIDSQIEEMVNSCSACQSVRSRPPAVTLHPWTWPTRPWQRIHVDYAGPFLGSMFLVVVDAHSKWVEVIMMSSTTSEKTITELWKLFAAHGLPEQLVSDNGPQFTSMEFDVFLKSNGVRHICSAPYHPQSNGEAERFVQTFKNALKSGKLDEGSVQTKLSRFLLSYRTTPNSTTGLTPSELFVKRRIRTRLEPGVDAHVEKKQAMQKEQQEQEREFDIGQSVMVENVRGGSKWLPGIVLERSGAVSYRVQVGEEIWRRHADQMRSGRRELEDTTRSETLNSPDVLSSDPGTAVDILPPPAQQPSAPHTEDSARDDESPQVMSEPAPSEQSVEQANTPRYPRRERVPPDRLSHKF